MIFKDYFAIFFVLTSLQLAHSQEFVVLNTTTSSVKSATVSSYLNNNNYGDWDERFSVYNWTNQGNHNINRGILKFDFDILPENIEIENATLILYHASFPHHNVEVHSGENDFYIERVTSDWNSNTVTWDSQPFSTTENRVWVDNSSNNTQNYVIDVTAITQDMIDNPFNSFGYMFKHAVEQPYKNNIFASSNHHDLSLHPELIIEYNTVLNSDELSGVNFLTISPNPTTSLVRINCAFDVVVSNVVLRDCYGRRIRDYQDVENGIHIREKGSFLLEICTSKGKVFKKLVVQ